MPCSVSIDNRIYSVPDGPYTILTTEHAAHKGVRIQKEYQFSYPTSWVRIKTWEIDSGTWWSKVEENSLVEQPKLVDDRAVNIDKFLVKSPQGLMPLSSALRTYLEQKNDRTSKTFEEREKMHREKYPEPYGAKKTQTETDNQYFKEASPMEVKMKGSEFVTGTRVKIPDPRRTLGHEPCVYGTIVEMKETPTYRTQGKTLVCMDKPNPEEFQDESSKCGEGYGHFIETKRIRALPSLNRSSFKGIPEHVGVTTRNGFKHDGVYFPPYTVGRILCIVEGPGHTGTIASVAWLNLPDNKRGVWQSNDGEKVYKHCFNVPSHLLSWCRFSPESYKVRNIWYTTFSELKEGDYLVYQGERAMAVSPLRISEEQINRASYFVTKGVVLRHAGWDQSHQCVLGTIAGGMPKETWGQKLSLRKNDVRPLGETYLPAGQRVEVVAEVVFKKRNLQGRTGEVILPTDEDGDVGVEFPEDIGAGSLDGAGKQGRCLYVPANTLKKTSR